MLVWTRNKFKKNCFKTDLQIGLMDIFQVPGICFSRIAMRMSKQNDFSTTSGGQSITKWIAALKEGDHFAAQRLWGYLQQRLVTYAQRLVQVPPAHYDEEDVALSAFGALCDGLEKGRYSDVDNRTDLWKLLAVIAMNKARKRADHDNRLKRGGGHAKLTDGDAVLNLISSSDPPPDLLMSMQEECQKKLNSLQQEELKLVVMLKIEGYTNEEIAETMGCTRRSIQRRLVLIREIWTEDDCE